VLLGAMVSLDCGRGCGLIRPIGLQAKQWVNGQAKHWVYGRLAFWRLGRQLLVGTRQWAKQLVKPNAECAQRLATAMPQTEESQLAFADQVFLAEVDLLGLILQGVNEVGLRQVQT